MSLVYAYEPDGTRHLIRIECDEAGCEESIKPNPQITSSGWMKRGESVGSCILEWHYPTILRADETLKTPLRTKKCLEA